MRKRQQVHLGRELHRGMPPIPIGKNSQLPAAGYRLHLVLRSFQFIARVARPGRKGFRQLRGCGRIGLGDLQHVHPIERRELIEVDNVIVQGMRDENQITNVLRVGRHFQLQGVFHGTHAGHRMDGRTDAAKALREEPCITGIAAAKNLLDSTPHSAGRPGVADGVVVNLHIHAEMTFDSGDGVDRDSLCHGTCR